MWIWSQVCWPEISEGMQLEKPRNKPMQHNIVSRMKTESSWLRYTGWFLFFPVVIGYSLSWTLKDWVMTHGNEGYMGSVFDHLPPHASMCGLFLHDWFTDWEVSAGVMFLSLSCQPSPLPSLLLHSYSSPLPFSPSLLFLFSSLSFSLFHFNYLMHSGKAPGD